DLFSLGSVLYAMATGRPPFRASTTMAVLRRVSDDAPTPIRESRPELPEWLAAIIERLQAKQPAERYQSAREVAEMLGQYLAQVQHPAAHLPPPELPAVPVRRGPAYPPKSPQPGIPPAPAWLGIAPWALVLVLFA